MLNPPIVDLLKKLVEIPSVHSRPHEIERCASFIAKYLTEADIQFQHFNYKGTPSILAGPQNREPKILLMSHLWPTKRRRTEPGAFVRIRGASAL